VPDNTVVKSITVRQSRVSSCQSLLTSLRNNVRVYTTCRAVVCLLHTAAWKQQQQQQQMKISLNQGLMRYIQLRVTIGDETIGLGYVTVQVYTLTYNNTYSIYTLLDTWSTDRTRMYTHTCTY
jgi:hypothetical protein